MEEHTAEADLARVWKTVCIVLIFFMQLGFAMLEVGSCREKHHNTVLLKNVLDALVSIPASAVVLSFSSLCRPNGVLDLTELLFQAVFANTAATIVSGAMAERLTVTSYFFITLVLSSAFYPFLAAAAWGQDLFLGQWLESAYEFCDLGEHRYHDYAGSGVVHVTGGWTAFIGAGFVGARLQVLNSVVKHRFEAEGEEVEDEEKEFRAWSRPMQVMGTVILWVGWFGFNAGSSVSGIEVITWNTTLVPCIAGTTGFIRWWCSPTLNLLLVAFRCIAAPPIQFTPPVPPPAAIGAGPAEEDGVAGVAGAGVAPGGGGFAAAGPGAAPIRGGAAAAVGEEGGGKPGCWQNCLQVREDPISFVCNCTLSGLVSITAACDIASGWQPAVLGVVVGLLYPFFSQLVQWLRFDDPVNAMAVHLFPGVLGVFFVALVKPDCDMGQQFAAQALGLSVILLWTAGGVVIWLLLAASDATLAAQHDQFRIAINGLMSDAPGFMVPLSTAQREMYKMELPQGIMDMLVRDHAWGPTGHPGANIDAIKLQADLAQIKHLKSISDLNERLKWQDAEAWAQKLVRIVREQIPTLEPRDRSETKIGDRSLALLDDEAREALESATSGTRLDTVRLKHSWEQQIHKMHDSRSGFWNWFKRHWCPGDQIRSCKRRRIHSFFPRLRLDRTAELEGYLLFLGYGVGGLETPEQRRVRLRGFQVPAVDEILAMSAADLQRLIARLMQASKDARGLSREAETSLQMLAMELRRPSWSDGTLRNLHADVLRDLANI